MLLWQWNLCFWQDKLWKFTLAVGSWHLVDWWWWIGRLRVRGNCKSEIEIALTTKWFISGFHRPGRQFLQAGWEKDFSRVQILQHLACETNRPSPPSAATALLRYSTWCCLLVEKFKIWFRQCLPVHGSCGYWFYGWENEYFPQISSQDILPVFEWINSGKDHRHQCLPNAMEWYQLA